MKVVLMQKNSIKSKKDGRDWVIYRGLSTGSGEPVELFLSKEESDAYGIPETKILDRNTLKEFLDEQETVEVEFNQRGRVDSVDSK